MAGELATCCLLDDIDDDIGNSGTLFSTGAGGALFTFDFELPTDDDEAGDGGSYKSGTTTDFWVGSRLAFSRLALGDEVADDEPSAGEPDPGDSATAPAPPWAAKFWSLSRATLDELVGQVERSLMVKPLRLIWSLSNFS